MSLMTGAGYLTLIVNFILLHICVVALHANGHRSTEAFFQHRATDTVSRGVREPFVRRARDADTLELACGENCFCYNDLTKYYDAQYMVICNKTSNMPVTLSSRVFEDEPAPIRAQRVYVVVKDVPGVVVTAGFVSRCLAYYSCTLDIWRAGNISLPTEEIPTAPTYAEFFMSFAGLDIKHSSLSPIPLGLFAGKDDYGLALQNVTLTSLNLHNLVYPDSAALRYLRLDDVTLGRLQGKQENVEATDSYQINTCCSITLREGTYGSIPDGVWITNSRIGVVESNSLNFESLQSHMVVSLKNNEIGDIQESGLKLIYNIEIEILNNRITFENNNSLIMDDVISFTLVNNTIVLPSNLINTLDCEKNDISGNNFTLILNELIEGNGNNGYRETSRQTDQNVSEILDHFIHSSCIKQNKYLNLPQFSPQETSTVSVTHDIQITNPSLELFTFFTATQNQTIEQMVNTSGPTLNSNSSTKTQIAGRITENYIRVHKAIAFLAFGALIVLCVVIIVLVVMLSCRRKRPHHTQGNSTEAATRARKSSLMYVAGSSFGNDTWPMNLPSNMNLM